MAVTIEKKSFLDRVKESFATGDDRKLVKFQKGVVSWANDQIKTLNARIDKNSEKLEDAEESIEEYLLAVDFDCIKDTDARDRYIERYIGGYDKRIADMDELKDKIYTDTVIIQKRKALIERMK